MVARALLLLLLFAPAAAAQFTLDVTADHEPWDVSSVPRFAVRPGNCMTWQALVLDDGEPVFGAGITVTDGDGRHSILRSDKEGRVTIGTQTCWTTDHISDHTFEVTSTLDGQNASSNRIVHEVMWSGGQVYADAPEEASGPTQVAIAVVWTATNEPMPVRVAHVAFDGEATQVDLENGAGVVTLDVQRSANLTVSVPTDAWLQGTPGAAIPVRQAGPLPIRLASDGADGDAEGDEDDEGTSSGSGGGGGGGGGSGNAQPSDEETPGRGTPPPAEPPQREDDDVSTTGDPDTQNDMDNQGGLDDDVPGFDGNPGNGAPAPSMVWTVSSILLILWSRRT